MNNALNAGKSGIALKIHKKILYRKLDFNFPSGRSRFANFIISAEKRFVDHLIMECGAKRL